MAELLLEIGLEEIPARMIAAAEAELARRVKDLLDRERLAGLDLEVRSYSTPRRLAVHASGVMPAQPDAEEQLTGPAWAVAFKDGAPTPAAHAFAKKAGVPLDALAPLLTAKGEYASAIAYRPGRAAADLLPSQLAREIGALAWPKNMYWRAGKPERFVRPVTWLLALLDHSILPVAFGGVEAGNLTYGHRILHGRAALTIDHPSEYVAALEDAKVIVDVAARRSKIRRHLDAATRTIPEARWREDEPLIETVVHLTEWPSALLGSFDPEYLALPEEVLVTVMRDHQKYFAVEDQSGRLTGNFLAVLNTEPHATIRHGAERVLRARFNDARFFWNFDQKLSLSDRVELLKSATFHKELGSYAEKTQRTRAIALELAERAAERGTVVNLTALSLAAQLSKTDLTSELVKEFTELQGIVGGLYARAQALGEEVAQAIYWQYQPASAGAPIPPTVEGQLLGLAERIGTVVDMFHLGLAPSGSRDPFALRRAANAVVKILAEGRLPLTFSDLLAAASDPLTAAEKMPARPTHDKLPDFLRERVEFYLGEVKGVRFDIIHAVLAAGSDSMPDAIARAEALEQVRGSEDFAAISAAFKRSKNILRQAAEKEPLPAQTAIASELFYEPAERSLHDAAESLRPSVEALREQRNYAAALEQIATLRPQVDLFFDTVMVMVEDRAVRRNRLALLALIVGEFSQIADFSEIVPAHAPVGAAR